MPNMPRALVVAPVIDGKAMLKALDVTATGFAGAGLIRAQLINNASVISNGKTWNLFTFLDEGTKPHVIGKPGEVLADVGGAFGPVTGPVFHPGTRPYDISSRVAGFFTMLLDQMVNTRVASVADTNSGRVPWMQFRSTVIAALLAAQDFAVSITPDSWMSVKKGYDLTVNGRHLKEGDVTKALGAIES